MRVHHRFLAALAAAVLALPAFAADLTIALGTDVTATDPHYHNLTPNNNVASHLYGYLVERNEKSQPMPSLATEWKPMSFGKPASHPKQKHLQDDTGMQYITIHVKALKPILERIKANDVKLLGETPFLMGGTTYFTLVQDPDGTFVELIGPME